MPAGVQVDFRSAEADTISHLMIKMRVHSDYEPSHPHNKVDIQSPVKAAKPVTDSCHKGHVALKQVDIQCRT